MKQLKVMNKKIIITGVIIGKGGTGKFVEYISNHYDVEIISSAYVRASIKELLSEKKIGSIIRELIRRKYPKQCFRNNLKKIKNRDIIIMHPQSIGLDNVICLLDKPKGNNIYYYVLDNCFFCLKSYNLRNGSECLDCINGNYTNAVKYECETFPKSIPTNLFIQFQKTLMKNKDKVHFLSQNDLQAELLKHQYGNRINVDVIGMIPSDYNQIEFPLEKKNFKVFDYVFHGNEVDAKGFRYAMEIAKLQKDKTFLFPFKSPDTIPDIPENTFFIEMTWETGLYEMLQTCEVILCFSLWSAPIEGSIIKSIRMGKKVAVFCTEYSFSNELSDDLVLKIKGFDIKNNSKLIERYYNDINNNKLVSFNSKIDIIKEKIESFFGECK